MSTRHCPLASAGARANGGVGVVVGGVGEAGGRGGGEAPGGGGGEGGSSGWRPCSWCSSQDHTAGAAGLGPSLKHFQMRSLQTSLEDAIAYDPKTSPTHRQG